MILYKYCPIDRVSVLREQHIYFTRPAVLNDPFEVHPPLVLEQPAATRVAEVPWFANLLAEAGSRDPDRAAELALGSIVVLSLSSRADSLLMWSHYADWHAGFVIALDTSHPTLAQGRFRHLGQVRYLHDRPTSTLDRLVATDELMLAKSVEWHYEAEWRMLDSTWASIGEPLAGNPDSWPFPLDPAAVREVIVGCRARPALAEELGDALDTPAFAHVRVRHTAIDPSRFRLNISAPQDARQSRRPHPIVKDAAHAP
jgi:hypothetical protein